ncbi:Purple acid phosphatase 17 [Linum perenne]
MSLVSFLFFCVLTAIPSCSFSQLTRLEQQVKDDGSLSLLVIGDWGRRGLYNQSQVASQMGRIGEELDIDFVISTGDNFYDDGLKGLHDPAFEDSFSRVYAANSLQKPWYTVLGNHDYRGKIVVGHHPIRSIGHHGDTQDLIQNLLPILKANNVDMYINGHDHCLEHISSHDSPIQYLTSGGGSKAWNGDIKSYDERVMKFYYDGQGFISMQLTDTSVEVLFHDVFGQVLHRWHVSKDLHSSV